MSQELQLDDEIALIEAVLFLEGEPVDEQSLSRISGLSPDIIERVLELLKERLSQPGHGLELIQISGGYMFSPKKELKECLKDRYGKKNDSKLSRAALETLSIIAYSQPITRGEVEAIRGVQADNMIRLLVEKNLIKEVGKKDVIGKPTQYGTTKEFLKFFRLNSIAELPKLDELDEARFELDGE